MTEKTHYKRNLDKDWIGAYILPEGKPIIVKLISVKFEHIKAGGHEQDRYVAYFAKNKHFDKPMILSAEKNRKRLCALTGSEYIEDWLELDLWVTLKREMDKLPSGGKDWCLRFDSQAPQMKTIADYPNEKKSLEDCKTLAELQTAYLALSVELQKLFVTTKNDLKTKLS